MIKQNLTLRKTKCLNGEFWHAVDETEKIITACGKAAFECYPVIDYAKPYGEMAATLSDNFEGKQMEFLIAGGHALFINHN